VDAGYSYYDGSACHLDLVQWATDPVWGDLEEAEQEKLLEADLHFFREQLSYEHIRLLLLCGKTVMEQYRRHFKDALPNKPFLIDGRIKLYNGRAPNGLVLVGWNINIQRGGNLDVIGDAVKEVWESGNFGQRRKPKMKNSNREAKPTRYSCRKVSKKAAVSLSEAADILRQWRKSYPRATRLDGRSGEDSKRGVVMSIGFISRWKDMAAVTDLDRAMVKSFAGRITTASLTFMQTQR